MTQPRKVLLLVALLAVGGFLLVLNARDDERPPGAEGPRARATGASGRRAATIEAQDVPVVQSLAFKPVVEETFERERDLFGYARSPAELEEEERRNQEARRQAEVAAEAARVAAEQAAEQARLRNAEQAKIDAERRQREEEARRNAPPAPPVPPAFVHRYVGIIGPKEDAYAILADSGGKFSYARRGDVIGEKFQVERVGPLNMVISYTDPRFTGEFLQVPRVLKDVAAVGVVGVPPPAAGPRRQPVRR